MSLQTKEVCVCDECGVEREKDTNHWWLLCHFPPDDCFIVRTWDDVVAKLESSRHICGLTCLYKAIDKLAQKILREEAVTK